eukprot:scaffold170287_cov22-Tisochrysis_lutea.AAC.1
MGAATPALCADQASTAATAWSATACAACAVPAARGRWMLTGRTAPTGQVTYVLARWVHLECRAMSHM